MSYHRRWGKGGTDRNVSFFHSYKIVSIIVIRDFSCYPPPGRSLHNNSTGTLQECLKNF